MPIHHHVTHSISEGTCPVARPQIVKYNVNCSIPPWCVYVWVCVFVSVCLFGHVCMCPCLYILCMYTCMCVHVCSHNEYMCTHVCVCIVFSCMCPCLYILCMYVCPCMCVCVCICMNTYAHVCVCIVYVSVFVCSVYNVFVKKGVPKHPWGYKQKLHIIMIRSVWKLAIQTLIYHLIASALV